MRTTPLRQLERFLETPGSVVVAVAMLVGSWARLRGIGLGFFGVDQVRDAVVATGIATGQNFPLVGPQSAQSTIEISGPLYYYLVAIPYAISADPIVGHWFTAILSIAALLLAHRLATEMFGPTVGAVATLLYATCPMVVLSGLPLWNPGLVPVFALGFLLVTWRYVTGRDPRLLAPALVLLAVVLNLHLSGIGFLLLLPLAWMLYRPRVRPVPLAVGLAGALLFYVPFLVAEAGEGFPRLKRTAEWIVSDVEQGAVLRITWRALSGPFLLPVSLAAAPATVDASLLRAFEVTQVVELCLLAAGIALLVATLVPTLVPRLVPTLAPSVNRSIDPRPFVLLAVWFGVPLLIFPRSAADMLWYYFDIIYPAQFIVIGLLVEWALREGSGAGVWWRSTVVRAAVVTTLGVIVIGQIWFLGHFFASTRAGGVLRATNEVILSRPEGPPPALESMPLETKRSLALAFSDRLGLDQADLERRAHGALYQEFREGRGYLLGALGGAPADTSNDGMPHVVIARDDAPIGQARMPAIDAGPTTF